MNDLLALINMFNNNIVPVSQVGFGVFNMFLVVGSLISHLSTVVILLKNAGNLKDEEDRRNLQIVATLAVVNQTLYFIFCVVSLWELYISAAVLWVFWAFDHVIFIQVNRHIKKFLISNNHSDSSESGNFHHRSSKVGSHPSSPREMEAHKPSTTTENSVGKAHERFAGETVS